MSRATFNWILGFVSAVFALFSLYVAIKVAFTSSYEIFGFTAKQLGKTLVAVWALAPPVFFWVDWVVFCRGLTEAEKSKAKHTHDLSRNIWLALIGVLVVVFGLKW